eukprot:s4112_g4.t1
MLVDEVPSRACVRGSIMRAWPPWLSQLSFVALLVASFSARLEAELSEAAWPALKVVVNSNVKYEVPLKILLRSMKKANFSNFNDVIIVIGGADADRIYTKNHMTYIETPFMNFDLTGLSMLGRYRDDPRVLARAYFYLLDTTTVGEGFSEKLLALNDVGYKEYRGVRRPAANICSFGRGILEELHSNFDKKMSKGEGLFFEFGYEPKGMKHFEDVATKITMLRDRRELGDPVDLYSTGYPRAVYWYPDFAVYKYILLGKSGDMDGNVTDTNDSCREAGVVS